MKQYHVYILANRKNGALYIGMTGEIQKRLYQHKHKLIEGFTKKYDIDRLVYIEVYDNPGDAIKREKQLKHWNRKWKIELIEQNNYYWKDLSEGWI